MNNNFHMPFIIGFIDYVAQYDYNQEKCITSFIQLDIVLEVGASWG